MNVTIHIQNQAFNSTSFPFHYRINIFRTIRSVSYSQPSQEELYRDNMKQVIEIIKRVDTRRVTLRAFSLSVQTITATNIIEKVNMTQVDVAHHKWLPPIS